MSRLDASRLAEIRDLCANGLTSITDSGNVTPLILASAKAGKLAVVKVLVESGADVNLQVRGDSALSAAAINENQDIIEYLKRHGAKGGFAIRRSSSDGDSVTYY